MWYHLPANLLSFRTPTDNEIDFVADWADGVAFEGKYIDSRLKREMRTVQAQVQAGKFRAGVLATRGELLLKGPVWAVPMGILGWLLTE